MTELLSIKDTIPQGWTGEPGREQASQLCVGKWSALIHKLYGQRIRFNLLHSRPEIDGQEVNENQLEYLYVVLGEQGWMISQSAARDAWMRQAYLNEYHPVVEYLEMLGECDEVEPVDLDLVAREYLGVENQLDAAKVAAMLVGAVQRALNPGCKFDNCLVLKGEQGIRKSSFFKALARPDWFIDTQHDKDLDLRLAVHQCWIYEFQELESLTTKKDASKVKGNLTTATDSFKRPYGRAVTNHLRRSIFVGTVNRDDFLRDSTGNRRFWIVELPHNANKGEYIDIDSVTRDRDRIWKAAYLAFKAGRMPILTHEQAMAVSRENENFSLENWCESALEKWLSHRRQIGSPETFSLNDAMEGAGPKATTQVVCEALKALGCERLPRSRKTGRVRLWQAPSVADLYKEETIVEIENAPGIWEEIP